MKFPIDMETIRSFLGMVNYLNKYSALCAPLSALTYQAKDYKLMEEHIKPFEQVKKEFPGWGLFLTLISM